MTSAHNKSSLALNTLVHTLTNKPYLCSKVLYGGKWSCLRFLMTFHLSSERLLELFCVCGISGITKQERTIE